MRFEVNHDEESALPILVIINDDSVRLVVEDGADKTLMVMRKSELDEIHRRIHEED